jgi:D-lactate dehydrogenase
MRISIFDANPLERSFFEQANCQNAHELVFLAAPLTRDSVALAKNSLAVCALSGDRLDKDLLADLHALGVKTIVLPAESVQFIDLTVAATLEIDVQWVPRTSHQGVAEYTLALILMLARRVHLACDMEDAASEGAFPAPGLELAKRTVGLIGLGPVGSLVGSILRGFGCTVLAYDPHAKTPLSVGDIRLTKLEELYCSSDIISLHCPLTSYSRRMIDSSAISLCKRGLMLINTASPALLDLPAVVSGLKRGWLSAVGIDINDEEADRKLQTPHATPELKAALRPFSNTVVTNRQGACTRDALTSFAEGALEMAAGSRKHVGQLVSRVA